MKKTLWTVNVNNYAPEVTELTYPLLKRYAKKCGADFEVITERKFPDWPVTYEKLQVHERGRDSDWNMVIDGDTVIHPDFFNVTEHLDPDTVCHNANDLASNRWKYDQYFRRDGRNIGSCNWFTVGSNLCLDLWRPLDDLTLEQALENIMPTVHERATHVQRCTNPKCRFEFPSDKDAEAIGECALCGQPRKRRPKPVIDREHLIDDYTLSRNIARFGLKFTTVRALQEKLKDQSFYLWHWYTITTAEKIEKIKEVLLGWGITKL